MRPRGTGTPRASALPAPSTSPARTLLTFSKSSQPFGASRGKGPKGQKAARPGLQPGLPSPGLQGNPPLHPPPHPNPGVSRSPGRPAPPRAPQAGSGQGSRDTHLSPWRLRERNAASTAQARRHNGRPGGGTTGRASAPAHSLSAGSARAAAAPSAPRARAALANKPAGSGRQTHSALCRPSNRLAPPRPPAAACPAPPSPRVPTQAAQPAVSPLLSGTHLSNLLPALLPDPSESCLLALLLAPHSVPPSHPWNRPHSSHTLNVPRQAAH